MTIEHVKTADLLTFIGEKYEYSVHPNLPIIVPEMFEFCRQHIGENLIVGGHLSPTERNIWVYEVDVDRPWAFAYPRFHFKSLSHAMLFKLRFG